LCQLFVITIREGAPRVSCSIIPASPSSPHRLACSGLKAEALVQVAKFSEFTADNDPSDEHDFGSFMLVGRKFFWKIDLYEEPDVKSENGEPVVTRVLTIMLAGEY
jgi:hypothetical protein